MYLLEKIELTREKLNYELEQNGFILNSTVIVEISKELDDLINLYHEKEENFHHNY